MHDLELNWIHRLHELLRNSFTDTFFLYWDAVDSLWFVLAFVCTITYLFNRKKGLSLLFLFVLSGIVNMSLKHLFGSPRPCQIDPTVGIIQCYNSLGFPSGAAQSATIYAWLALTQLKKPIFRALGVLFALFLCFSRIYLGLHFFTDILGGIFVGSLLVLIYKYFFPHFEDQWEKVAFVLTPLFVLLGGPKRLSASILTLGFGIGLLFGKKIKLSSSLYTRIVTFLIVLIGIEGLIYFGQTHDRFLYAAAFLGGLWFVSLGSYLVEKTTRV